MILGWLRNYEGALSHMGVALARTKMERSLKTCC